MVATSIGVMPPAPNNIDGKAGNSRLTPRRPSVLRTFGTPTARPRRAVDRL
ncbi:hypothetical protein D3C76_913300 [compost metagenome]